MWEREECDGTELSLPWREKHNKPWAQHRKAPWGLRVEKFVHQVLSSATAQMSKGLGHRERMAEAESNQGELSLPNGESQTNHAHSGRKGVWEPETHRFSSSLPNPSLLSVNQGIRTPDRMS